MTIQVNHGWLLIAKATLSILIFYAVNQYLYMPLFTTNNPNYGQTPKQQSPLTTILVHLAVFGSLTFSARSFYDLYRYGQTLNGKSE